MRTKTTIPCEYVNDTITINHTNCIPRSSLPELPEGWKGPFRVDWVWGKSIRDAKNQTCEDADFIAALLNAAYAAPAEGGE